MLDRAALSAGVSGRRKEAPMKAFIPTGDPAEPVRYAEVPEPELRTNEALSTQVSFRRLPVPRNAKNF